jgi:thioesterase domain-containing protein
LLEMGWRVKFLGILDTSLQLARLEALHNPKGLAEKAKHVLLDISQRGLFSGLIYKVALQSRLRPVVRRLAPLWRFPRRNRAFLWYRHKAVLFLRWDLALRWLQRPEPARVSTYSVVFRSEQYAEDETADMGWGALLDPLTVVQVRGDHHSMFRQTGYATLSQLFFDALMEAETDKSMIKEVAEST